MADNLLQICQNVADACQLSRPDFIVNNTDETARILLSRAKHEIEALARRPDSHWSVLERAFEFSTTPVTGTTTTTFTNKCADIGAAFITDGVKVGDIVINTTDNTSATILTVANQLLDLDADIFVSGENYQIYKNQYALPTDFKHMIDQTHWNKDTFWSMRGPMTPMEWRHYKHSVLGNSVTLRNRWRIMSGSVNPATPDINPGIFMRLDPTPSEDQDFIYEYVSNGLVVDASGDLQTTWISDTDTPVLDQFLIELGTIWRTLSRLGMPYAEELDEYEVQVEAAIGRDGGGRVLDLARTTKPSFLSSDNVPDTGIGQ